MINLDFYIRNKRDVFSFGNEIDILKVEIKENIVTLEIRK